MKNFIKKHNLNFWNLDKKIIYKNLIIFFILFVFLIVMDQVFKAIFFQPGANFTGNRVNTFHWGFFGILSLENEGLTSAIPFDSVTIQVLSFLLLFFISFLIVFAKNSFLAISTTIIFAGVLGNLIDRLIFGGKVKDIFYIGSATSNTGIFNLADLYAVIGSILLLAYIFWLIFFQDKFLIWLKKKNHVVKKINSLNEKDIEKKFIKDFNSDDYDKLFNDKTTTMTINNETTNISNSKNDDPTLK